MNLTVMEDNIFARLLYEKPVSLKSYSILKKIKIWIKRKNYESTVIKPQINKLRTTAPSFITMCEMADFIKILEKVFFYRNDITKGSELEKLPKNELKTKILSDNNIVVNDKKAIIIDMEKEKITIKFNMSRTWNTTSKNYDDIIDVNMYYNFGKKLIIKFQIINATIKFDSIHDDNLMYNINNILQNAMADIFEEYYKLV